MMGLLLLGFLVGMRHAIEADHVAAVASLTTRNAGLGHSIKQGAVWGVGHTLTLFVFGSAVLFLDAVIPEQFALGLELAVGIMLVGLGADVLRRLYRERMHVHAHRHGDDAVHFHFHAHGIREHHDPRHHSHEHAGGFPVRALLVGMMHGMAGSAALILLTLQTVTSPLVGVLYIAVFGLGSMVGMAAISFVIAVPLRHSAKGLTWFHNALHAVVGLATVGLGTTLIVEIAPRVFA